MVGEPVDPDDDPTVLDAPLRIEQLEADEADVGLLGPTHQLAQPAGIDQFGVVVQEDEHVASCARRPRRC